MSKLKKCFAFAGVVITVIYIANPSFGVFELIPDNLPLIGNLDEASATALLLVCLRTLGLDIIPSRKQKIINITPPKDDQT